MTEATTVAEITNQKPATLLKAAEPKAIRHDSEKWLKFFLNNKQIAFMRKLGIDAPICQDSRSRSQVCGLARSVVCHHALKDLAGEKAFETADDLPFGPPFSGASFDVVEGW